MNQTLAVIGGGILIIILAAVLYGKGNNSVVPDVPSAPVTQNDNYQQHQTKSTTRRITPASAVWPGRNRAD